MNLRFRLLLFFAATVLGGMAVLYFLSRSLLLRSFEALETEQIQQDLEYVRDAVNEENRQLGTVANDYAYWDRTYQFVANPTNGNIAGEFQDGTLEGLKLDLIVIRDLQGHTLFEKYYDARKHHAEAVPKSVLNEVLAHPGMSVASLSRMPRDGLLTLPDGTFIVSVRPILTSQRTGQPRGILLAARRFDESSTSRIGALYRTSVNFEHIPSTTLSPDFRLALASLQGDEDSSFILPLAQDNIAGYRIIRNLFDEPFLLVRVDTARPIFERGKLSQLYLFATVCLCTLLSSVVIFFLFQKFVFTRLSSLDRQVTSIGERKAISERITLTGRDELSSLAVSINGMLQELERTQSHFLFLTENIHQIFWVKDARTGKYEYVSQAFEQVIGSSRDTVLRDPESWKALVLPEDAFLIQRMLQQQARGEASEVYFRLNSVEGTVKWLWERFFPTFGPEGQLRQIIGLTEDITEFKRHEEALLRAQQELEVRVKERTRELAERGELVKLLVDSTPVAMYGMDSEGNLTFCNPAALRLLGYGHSSEVLGKMSHALIHHSRQDGSPYPVSDCPVFASFHEGTEAHVVDEVFWRKDGTSFPVEYDSRQIRRAGRVVGVVVSFVDVTLRRRQELEDRHSQKLEAVGRLAAGIAHEINTPIQFIGDNTRFLQDSFVSELKLIRVYERLQAAVAAGAVNAELLALLEATRREVEWDYLEEEIPRALSQTLEGLRRVSTIIRGMKEFSHVDRSNEKSPSDLNRALESTLIVTRSELKYFADVETDFADLPPVVCNLGDINQVFLNLIVNASHAVEDAVQNSGGRGKITIRTRLDGQFVVISITDNGTGIPEEARGKIFEPFFTTKQVGRGTGQGLALARAIIVEKHGGTLSFETEVGKGTTFTVRLPVSGSPVREEALVS